MKASFKYPKWPIYLFTLNGVLTMAFILSGYEEVIGLGRIITSLLILVLYVLMGLGVALWSGTNFHRKVDHPVDPDELTPGTIYWLNGQTRATFMGKDNGKLRFQVWGLNDPDDPSDRELISPWRVSTYISSTQEVK